MWIETDSRSKENAMTAVTYIHIILGTIAVLSGAAALIASKGSNVHRLAGNFFFISMIIMALWGWCADCGVRT